MKEQKVIDQFDIPEEIAKNLSELLAKQAIKERLLIQLIDDDVKYNKVESSLIPIAEAIEGIKVNITRNFVPQKYRSPEYVWNYNGYSVDSNKVEIIGVEQRQNTFNFAG